MHIKLCIEIDITKADGEREFASLLDKRVFLLGIVGLEDKIEKVIGMECGITM